MALISDLPNATPQKSDLMEIQNGQTSSNNSTVGQLMQLSASENLAPAYDASAGVYEVGDFVSYDGTLYQCNTAIATPEAFDATKWTAIKVTEISSGASVVQLTQAEYTALSTAEKMNGSIYKLTDKAIFYCLDEEYHAVLEITSADYALLTSAEKNNGTLYVITDEETTAADIPYSAGMSVADKLDTIPTFDTLTTSDNNKLLGVSVSGSDISVGAVELIKSGTATLNSPRISINNQSGTYYRVGNIVTAKITIVFNSDGQNLGAYFNTFALDGVSTNTTKLMGFMGVDNDLYELETLNNDSIWVYKNGTRINAVNLNGKTAYLTIHATL